MKQYLSQEQTAKLIELGLPRPKYILDVWAHETDIDVEYEYECAYSIGELIEMLPDVIESEDSEYATPQIYFDLFNWIIEYTGVEKTEYATSAIELIDALYDMIIMLKEEGII